MSEQYMASVIYLRLEELRSDVFWGWTKARVDEIKDLFDEYLSTQAGERKDLFLKVADLEGKVAELESRLNAKTSDNKVLLGLVDSHKKLYGELKNLHEQDRAWIADVAHDLANFCNLKVEGK